MLNETLADRLIIAAGQLRITDDRITRPDVTADDMREIVRYLDALAEHGHAVCALAERVIDRAGPEHATRAGLAAIDLQVSIGHAQSMFDAAIHFASDAEQALDAAKEEQ